MDGINAIVEHILKEARERAAVLQTSAAEQVAEIKRQTDATCEEITKQSALKADLAAEAIINRAKSQAAMEHRRALLEARQLLIDQAISAALDHLVKLDPLAKSELYQSLIESLGAQDGLITANEQDHALVAQLLKKISGRFELNTVVGSFAGGLLLQRGKVVDNLTFDLLIRNQRPHLAALAASILFPDVD
ncbi:MAG: V-type ATP synthase subunit E [Eubacteriales bacterium]|nr:V-type ATP synthase subunit E [Eubacteriales bacterium]